MDGAEGGGQVRKANPIHGYLPSGPIPNRIGD
ncbi:hypothetical protein BM44_4334 [Burkholderia mallei NCTC 10247]|nr:hypothetical protein BM44_4334 [Burkholderia mallei NCTC 10247]AJX04267.1 hypothetical protein BM45_3458 [Burkholderia mallei]AJX46417.1 hypothetical protein BG99_3502 [Burkholderia mallei]KOS80560.1 hypothetical protein DM53_1248 [Burkholderia mallei]KOS87250.1 hypothetical protein DO61_65 [Burkholderia mallei]